MTKKVKAPLVGSVDIKLPGAPKPEFNRLRLLVEMYYDVQEVRIKAGNSIEDYASTGIITFIPEFGDAPLTVVGKLKYKMPEATDDPGRLRYKPVKDITQVDKTKAIASITWMPKDGPASKNKNLKIPAVQVVSFTGMVSDEDKKLTTKWIDGRMERMEVELKSQIEKTVPLSPIWDAWLGHIRGIGPCIGGGLLSVLDVKLASSPSAFYKICGLHVDDDGLAVHRERGVKLEYNPFLKVVCWKAGESFVKCKSDRSFYRRIYDRVRGEIDERFVPYLAKAEAEKKATGRDKNLPMLEMHGDVIDPASPCRRESHGDGHLILDSNGPIEKGTGKEKKRYSRIPCPDSHRYEMAKRKTVKLFLSHLWTVWRGVEGLPIRPPYPLVDHGEPGTPGFFQGHGLAAMIEPPKGDPE